MLLPSALPCDSSQRPPLTRLQSALFVSPPASPPQLSTQHAVGNIFTACRNLQSLLATPTLAPAPLSVPSPLITPPSTSHGPQQQHQSLPTPPLAHEPSPLKLRLRSRRAAGDSATGCGGAATDHPMMVRKKITKRASAPPRGLNKRRREDDDLDSDLELGESAATTATAAAADAEAAAHTTTLVVDSELALAPALLPRPQTPKRSRVAPAALPLGLERADFHSLLHADGGAGECAPGTDVEVEADGEPWSSEDDRILVELVLEKLQLTREDWQDCARSLGKDRVSVGRRWKSLMLHGDVGVRPSRNRRVKLHGTWR